MNATIHDPSVKTTEPAPGLYAEAAATLLSRAGLTESEIADMLSFARSLRLVTAAGIAAEEDCRRRLALAAADGSDLILNASRP